MVAEIIQHPCKNPMLHPVLAVLQPWENISVGIAVSKQTLVTIVLISFSYCLFKPISSFGCSCELAIPIGATLKHVEHSLAYT